MEDCWHKQLSMARYGMSPAFCVSCVRMLYVPFGQLRGKGWNSQEDLIHLVPSSGATARDGSEARKNGLIIDP
jgi:hypothetical protein